MAAVLVKTKHFQSFVQSPLSPPDGSSLEEMVNAFLATLTPANVLDVVFQTDAGGKYSLSAIYFAQVVYKG